MRVLGESTWRTTYEEKEQIKHLISDQGFCKLRGLHGVVILTANTLLIVEIGMNQYEVSKLNKPDYTH